MIDVTKIPRDLKSVLINVVTLPYWIVSIKLFHPELYITNDYLLLSCVCIGLALVSSILVSIILAKLDTKNNIFDYGTTKVSVVLQIIFLSSIIFTAYLCKILFSKTLLFYGFLLIYFCVLLVFVIYALYHET